MPPRTRLLLEDALSLQIIFRKRALQLVALLQKMTYNLVPQDSVEVHEDLHGVGVFRREGGVGRGHNPFQLIW